MCRFQKSFHFSALLGFIVCFIFSLTTVSAYAGSPIWHTASFMASTAISDSSDVDFDTESFDVIYPKNSLPDSVLARAYRPDSVHLRMFNNSALSHLRTQAEFIYDRPSPLPSPWDMLKQWLLKHLGQLFNEEVSSFLENSLYVIGVSIVIFLVFKFMNIDWRRAFFYSPKKLHDLGFRQDEFLNIDELTHLIEDAVSKKDYRRAVRYLFLRTLKDLAARELIAWRLDKTNRDYIDDLKRSDLKSSLADLVSLFEYVWYGEFELNETNFLQIRHTFATFNLQLRSS
jgi:hypothetical protein